MVMEYINTVINFGIFGNELWRYLLYIVFLWLTFPVAKVVNHVVNNILKKWAEKTSFALDDIVINSLNPSITMFIFAGMFYLGMLTLNPGVYDVLLQRIFNFLLIIPVVYFLIKFSTEAIGYYLKGKEGTKQRIKNEAAVDLLMQIVRIVLFIMGILLILANLGYNITALLTGLGVGGLAFALAAQDILKNFFAGIALIFDKTFNKGERVNFQGNAGIIEKLNLRSTKLRTYDGTLLTIPNAMLADNIVENVTKTPKVKVNMTIGVEYGTSVKKLEEAKEIIKKAIEGEEKAEDDSFIWFDNFSAYSLDIKVIYFGKLKESDWPEKVYFKDRINLTIKREFEKAKINMAFPTQTIELKK